MIMFLVNFLIYKYKNFITYKLYMLLFAQLRFLSPVYRIINLHQLKPVIMHQVCHEWGSALTSEVDQTATSISAI